MTVRRNRPPPPTVHWTKSEVCSLWPTGWAGLTTCPCEWLEDSHLLSLPACPWPCSRHSGRELTAHEAEHGYYVALYGKTCATLEERANSILSREGPGHWGCRRSWATWTPSLTSVSFIKSLGKSGRRRASATRTAAPQEGLCRFHCCGGYS